MAACRCPVYQLHELDPFLLQVDIYHHLRVLLQSNILVSGTVPRITFDHKKEVIVTSGSQMWPRE